MSVCTSRSWSFINLRLKVFLSVSIRCLWDDQGTTEKLTGSHVCVCVCVQGHVGSCAADWYHKRTMDWKVPWCQMKGRISRRGAEPRWALWVYQGRSDEEIIEKGPLPLERGTQGSVAYEMQKSLGRLNDQFQRVGSFPDRAPNPLKKRRKSNLDGEERY